MNSESNSGSSLITWTRAGEGMFVVLIEKDSKLFRGRRGCSVCELKVEIRTVLMARLLLSRGSVREKRDDVWPAVGVPLPRPVMSWSLGHNRLIDRLNEG